MHFNTVTDTIRKCHIDLGGGGGGGGGVERGPPVELLNNLVVPKVRFFFTKTQNIKSFQ